MIPFPGESLAIVDGTAYPELAVRAGTSTFPAGFDVRGWVYGGDTDYLEEAGADVTVSWVVEVASGAGTIVAAWGLDPTYTDSAAATPYSLGTHTVTGKTTLVLPTTLTAYDVLNYAGAFHLKLTVTSGTVTLQQLKLRVWPTVGVAGGWSDLKPPFTTDWVAPSIGYKSAPWTASTFGGDAKSAWDGAFAALSGPSLNPPNDFSTTDTAPHLIATATLSRNDISGGSTDFGCDVTAAVFIALIVGDEPAEHFGISPALVDGVDYIRPPDEVRGDNPAYVQQDGEGVTEWENAAMTFSMAGEPRTIGSFLVDSRGYSTALLPVAPISGGFTADAGPTFGSGTGVSNSTLPTTGAILLETWGSRIFVQVVHSSIVGRPSWPGESPSLVTPLDYVDNGSYVFGVAPTEGDFWPIRSRSWMPWYRVWNPAEVEPLRLMQRGDRLGMGSGRLLGLGTRQSSTRLFGSL